MILLSFLCSFGFGLFFSGAVHDFFVLFCFALYFQLLENNIKTVKDFIKTIYSCFDRVFINNSVIIIILIIINRVFRCFPFLRLLNFHIFKYKCIISPNLDLSHFL